MAVISAQQIGFSLPDGRALFRDLSFSLTHKRTALIGDNGAGKSVLGAIIAGRRTDYEGTLRGESEVGYFAQHDENSVADHVTVASFLGMDRVIEALDKIEQGATDRRWFDRVGDNWLAKKELEEALAAMSLPTCPSFCCRNLSGGQLARLQLWRCFLAEPAILVLDEPTNHLDRAGKQWLHHRLNTFAGHVLMITHDREFLQVAGEIWALSGGQLECFGGNYQFYQSRKHAEEASAKRQLEAAKKALKDHVRTQQQNEEKQAKRCRQGLKNQRNGSQAKIITDRKKDKASATGGARIRQAQVQKSALHDRYLTAQQRIKATQIQYMGLSCEQERRHGLLKIEHGRLVYGTSSEINLALKGGDKWHLRGPNGSGKSTLLKTLAGQLPLREGQFTCQARTFYLDQRFAVLSPKHTPLMHLMEGERPLGETDARTQLAGVGLYGEDVYKTVAELSAGERMKVAMLMAANQPENTVLLLDEPDNHLDLSSRRILAAAIRDYRGACVVVSHDTHFIDACQLDDVYDDG